jgi:hypothetical protein
MTDSDNPWDKIASILEPYVTVQEVKADLGVKCDNDELNKGTMTLKFQDTEGFLHHITNKEEVTMSNDAIATYLDLMTIYQNVGLCTELISSEDTDDLKCHQTVVFVWAAGVVNEGSRERMIRFVTSLNTKDTIKADILTVRGNGKFVRGLSFNGTKVPRTAAQMKMLDKLANKLGWVQSIILLPTNED